MAFKTAGGDTPEKSKYDGLPSAWENLASNCCPKCGEALSLFEHVSLYKCGCGFKISTSRFEEIRAKYTGADSFGENSGYRYGNYHDEPPFI